MRRSLFVGLAAASFLLALAHCKLAAGDAGIADAGTEPDAEGESDAGSDPGPCGTNEVGQQRDRCLCATSSPARGRECSPTNACPPELDCVYKAGCADPKGVCLDWLRCGDGGALWPPLCDCDGKLTYEGTKPFAFSDAGGPTNTMCGKDAAAADATAD